MAGLDRLADRKVSRNIIDQPQPGRTDEECEPCGVYQGQKAKSSLAWVWPWKKDASEAKPSSALDTYVSNTTPNLLLDMQGQDTPNMMQMHNLHSSSQDSQLRPQLLLLKQRMFHNEYFKTATVRANKFQILIYSWKIVTFTKVPPKFHPTEHTYLVFSNYPPDRCFHYRS